MHLTEAVKKAARRVGSRVGSSGYGILVVVLLAIAGCVSGPPVQEMSDARQAITVAKEAGAEEFASVEFNAAEAYLESAQIKLSERFYSTARKDAMLAKDKALEALARAGSAVKNDPI